MSADSDQCSDVIEAAIIELGEGRPWTFANEAEFKHELFHVLAQKEVAGELLSNPLPGEPSPRLHSEAKAQNGLPVKADLVVCSPSKRQRFNYTVKHLVELKMSLSPAAMREEFKKLDRYLDSFNNVWLVSNAPLRPEVAAANLTHPAARILRVRSVPEQTHTESEGTAEPPTLAQAASTVGECIDECLGRYGSGKKQFHSYFWCNFEHELERRHSFPCEGDFNAYLYHLLRSSLPRGVRIHSEYTPAYADKQRIDFLVAPHDGSWAIPIDVKMNWDQFKPKYVSGRPGVQRRSEALTISDRFHATWKEFAAVSPMLVVIQGDWRRPTKMRLEEDALAELRASPIDIELVAFHETAGCVRRRTLGVGS